MGNSNPSRQLLSILWKLDSWVKKPHVLVTIKLGILRDVRRRTVHHFTQNSSLQGWNVVSRESPDSGNPFTTVIPKPFG
jgi:hypothetical protein